VQIDVTGAGTISRDGTAVTLSAAHPGDTNTIRDPQKIVPVTEKVSDLGNTFTRTLAPYSITVLELHPS
jgi:alpha-N-arabinofuranosidase